MILEEIPNKYLRRTIMVLVTNVIIVCTIQMLIDKGFTKTIKYVGEWYIDMWNGL